MIPDVRPSPSRGQRRERERLEGLLRLQLGTALERNSEAELVARVDELTQSVRALERDLAAERSKAQQLLGSLTETQDELLAARDANRRLMKRMNSWTAASSGEEGAPSPDE